MSSPKEGLLVVADLKDSKYHSTRKDSSSDTACSDSKTLISDNSTQSSVSIPSLSLNPSAVDKTDGVIERDVTKLDDQADRKVGDKDTAAGTKGNRTAPKGKDLNEDLSDSGSQSDESLRHEANGWPYNVGNLDNRRRRVERRLRQSKAYSELLEDRVKDLERKVQKLLKLPEPTKEKSTNSKPIPQHEVKIKPLTWFEFSARFSHEQIEGTFRDAQHQPEINLSPQSVIELLTEEPGPVPFHLMHTLPVNTPLETCTSGQAIQPTGTAVIDSSIPIYRIRIRSIVLLKLMREVTELNTTIGRHKHQLVFIRPFKLLVSYERQLRERLQELEKMYGQGQNAITDGTKTRSASAPPTIGEKVQSNLQSGKGKENPPIEPSNETQTPEAYEHLSKLCELLDQAIEPKIRLRKFIDPKHQYKVAFSDLWYIFKPGDEVRTSGGNQIQLYRVMKVTGGRELLSKDIPKHLSPGGDQLINPASIKLKDQGYSEGAFVIECFYIDFDGTHYGPVNKTFQIRKFEGEKHITSLLVFPLIYDVNEATIHKKLIERGDKFAELSNPKKAKHMQYKGLTLDQHQEQVESQVIIDFHLAFIEKPENKPTIGVEFLVGDNDCEVRDSFTKCKTCSEPGCCGNDIIYPDYEIDVVEREKCKQTYKSLSDPTDNIDSLTPNQKALLPFRVFGFVLRTRRWATFNIELLTDVDFTDGWANLVIEKDIKETIVALVENHQRSTKNHMDGSLNSVDLVRGKGNGLIILLHGEPGVGKTSTAECVADHTRRPLFPITCGDIGDRADMVENSLETNFQLAHKWGCVLLLDEADIFLGKRTDTDLTRNAIVSVFLRTLEYYSGILFLTTNRIGKIDRAFKSRIHHSLFYDKLNSKRTFKIWENNLKRAEDSFRTDNMPFNFEKADILNFAKKHYRELKKVGLSAWNGRQIRNAFQTAIALANYAAQQENKKRELENTKPEIKTPTLSSKEFVKVAEASKQFDIYLRSLYHGKTDSQVARGDFWRIDEFTKDRMMDPRGPMPNKGGMTSKYRRTQEATSYECDSSSASTDESEQDPESGVEAVDSSSDDSSSEEVEEPKKSEKAKGKKRKHRSAAKGSKKKKKQKH